MKNTKLQEQLVSLRIALQNICDGFNVSDLNKVSSLTMRTKILFMVNKTPKCSPTILIGTLAIAKSNLALLCKTMCDEKVIVQNKGGDDKRNVYYTITEKGVAELKAFYEVMGKNSSEHLTVRECKTLEKKVIDILDFINKKYK